MGDDHHHLKQASHQHIHQLKNILRHVIAHSGWTNA